VRHSRESLTHSVIPWYICQLLSMVIWNVKPQNPIPRQEFFVSRGSPFLLLSFRLFFHVFTRLGVAVGAPLASTSMKSLICEGGRKTLGCLPHFIDLPSCLQVHLDNQLIDCSVPWCNWGAKPRECSTWFMISNDSRTRSAHISNASVSPSNAIKLVSGSPTSEGSVLGGGRQVREIQAHQCANFIWL